MRYTPEEWGFLPHPQSGVGRPCAKQIELIKSYQNSTGQAARLSAIIAVHLLSGLTSARKELCFNSAHASRNAPSLFVHPEQKKLQMKEAR